MTPVPLNGYRLYESVGHCMKGKLVASHDSVGRVRRARDRRVMVERVVKGLLVDEGQDQDDPVLAHGWRLDGVIEAVVHEVVSDAEVGWS